MSLTGFFGGMIESAAELIGGCAAFQSWVDAEDAEAADARIHRLVALGSDTVWPCVQITYGNGMRYERISSQGFSCRSGGALMLAFEAVAGDTVESDPAADQAAFANAVEGIVSEMMEASDTPGKLQVMAIGPEGPFEAFGVTRPRISGGAEVVVYRWVWMLRLP